MADNKRERETMVEWCSLISGYSKEYYEKMDDEKLLKEYTRIMNESSQTK
jgi:succinate dehydrogenase flavin-adding protein (antitoxin of CptAB toxin-antitoxin module)